MAHFQQIGPRVCYPLRSLKREPFDTSVPQTLRMGFRVVRAAAIEEGSEVLIAFSLPPEEMCLREIPNQPGFTKIPGCDSEAVR